MGGGSGAGLFKGTVGAFSSQASSAGRLLPIAEQVSAAPSESAEHSGGIGEAFSWLLEKLRPWQFQPYGHPEKTRKIQELRDVLGPPLRDMGRQFLGMNGLSPSKASLITNFVLALAKRWEERKRKEAEEKK